MPNVLITTSTFGEFDERALMKLKEVGLNYFLNPFRRKLTEIELIQLVEAHEPIALIAGVEPITRKVLSRTPHLKWISRVGSGIDNVDLQAAEDFGVKVYATPYAPVEAVKELTIAFMLNALRKVTFHDAEMHSGRWTRKEGRLLSRQTVGIVGFGKIGQSVAQTLRAFGSRILVYDNKVIEQDWVEQVSIEELFKHSDLISLHIPYTSETENMIHLDRLMTMKNDVILINTSRGEIMNETDLVEFLEKKPQAIACLDTYQIEPYQGPMNSLQNVILTPHIGSFAREARIEMEAEAVHNLCEALRSN